jgi:general secretion pathway protein I
MISAREQKVMTKQTRKSGFTLLEVLVAMAILASSLTVIMGTVATSSQQAIYANKMTRITELAKGKMLDIEYELRREGFQRNGQEMEGDFGEVGFGHIRWQADIQPINIPETVKQELKAKVNAQLFGGTKSEGVLTGNAAFSSMLPKLIGFVPKMINQIGEKVRRIKLIIYYDFAGKEQTVKLTQYVVNWKTNEFGLFGEESSKTEGASSGTALE